MKLTAIVRYKNKTQYLIEIMRDANIKPGDVLEIRYNPENCNQKLRGLLWELIGFLADEIGYTSKEMYIVLKNELKYYDTIITKQGIELHNYNSTANGEIDDKNLSRFYNDIERWAVNSGYNIEPYITQYEALKHEKI